MKMTEHHERPEHPEEFWDRRYRQASPDTSGRPGMVLRRFAQDLAPGRALELGCGKGDDAVWLASRGWAVLAVDISVAALEIASGNARRAGVLERIAFEQHDLSLSFPADHFDLVTACFLAAVPRDAVFRRAAGAVAKGGHLLIVDHGSRAPWSTAAPDRPFPTAEEILATLDLEERDWRRDHVGALERQATGPTGETAVVLDTVLFLERL